ncbi:MAG: hypothetical protein R3E10_07215 [Gemmatimonadota bacterium]
MGSLLRMLAATSLLALSAGGAAGQANVVNPHGTLPSDLDCASCHTANSWAPIKQSLDFDHGRTAFPLTGSHSEAQCVRCHLSLRFDQPKVELGDCTSCHLDVHQGALGQECATCHTTTSFQQVEAVELHARTEFPLTGSHLQVSCESCHVDDRGGAFSARDAECVSCHLGDYQRTNVIDHETLGFPTTCEQCHGTLSWRATESFDHARLSGGFGLVGGHVGIECASCHALPSLEPLWSPASQDDCLTCHTVDYEREHGGNGFPTTCLTCHTVETWSGAAIDHPALSGGFRLLGSHEQAACSSCHSGPQFGVVFSAANDEDCVACHQADYDGEHAGSGFPTTCTQCHTVDSWSRAQFDHQQMTGFPLLGEHATATCESCHIPPNHALRFQAQSANDCVACHQADYDRQHAGTQIPTECATCHSVDGWGTQTFDHVTISGGFQLLGRHLTAACSACHSGPNGALPWAPSSQDDCVACHRTDYDQQHAGTNIPTDCLACHTVNSWAGAAFDHTVQSGGFQLLGEHQKASCESCHSGPNNTVPWNAASQDDCVACHQADYDRQHGGSGFPTTCVDCHTVNGWGSAAFNHVDVSGGFALIGRHIEISCSRCHSGPNSTVPWSPANQDDCVACHQADYNAEHAGTGYPTTCLSCHTLNGWAGATFNHATVSGGFDLVGSHTTVACTTCHSGPNNAVPWTPANASDCVACHQADYNAEHAGTGYPTTCLDCHNVNQWTGGTFNHATVSGGFNLVGAHNAAQCNTCHSGPNNAVPWNPSNQDDCVACHQADYNAEHAGTGYPTTCLSCHNVNQWTGATFNHGSVSGGFNLVGAHNAAQCNTCHSGPNNAVPWNPSNQDDCVACHQADYNAEHAGTGYPTTCLSCHNVNQWTGATFNHGSVSGGFNLVGAHNAAQCNTCHSGPNNAVPWNPTNQDDCVACHQADYNAEHAGTGYPTTCLSCHNVNQWTGATFNHGSVSGGFNLVGAHNAAQCNTCHSGPGGAVPWNPTNQDDCVACHQADYNAEHAGTGYPTTCLSCHNVNQWTGATFNHSLVSGGFGLVGAHSSAQCSTCHSGPGGAVPWNPSNQNDCIACHQTDYNSEHAGTGYPTTCLDCHSQTQWSGASFNHDSAFFPIYSGKHQGKWSNNCATCHTDPTNYSVFTCLNCHAHNKTDMDSEHRGKSGYSYNSNACYNCHPRGRT